MRILNVNATIDPLQGGGTAERTFQLSRGYAQLGEQCSILTLDLGITPDRRAALGPVSVVALESWLPRYYLFRWSDPRIEESVAWADVVHLCGHWTLLNAAAYRAARRLKKPHVVCPAGALPIYGRSVALKKVYNALVGRALVRRAAAGVAIAPQEFEHFSRYGVPHDKVRLIPNGIDPAQFGNPDPAAFRKKFGLSDAPFVLFMGRLNPIKGPDLLLEAFAMAGAAARGFQLVYAGPDGGLLGELKSMTQRYGLSQSVAFIGPVGPRDKASAYAACELLAIPSRQEAMSIVVLEAGASDRPVLITDQCGFDDVERIGGGRVVAATAEGIKAGLLQLLAAGVARVEIGRALGDYVRRNFTWELACRRYLELFARLTR